jgi:hypothetical protein
MIGHSIGHMIARPMARIGEQRHQQFGHASDQRFHGRLSVANRIGNEMVVHIHQGQGLRDQEMPDGCLQADDEGSGEEHVPDLLVDC